VLSRAGQQSACQPSAGLAGKTAGALATAVGPFPSNMREPMQWLNNLAAEGAHATRLQTDLEYFVSNLMIRPKEGALVPFKPNAAQLKLHQALEEQKRRTGRVRAIVLKARQLGISTYVAARFYHRTISNPGLRTIIIGHERSASKNLFQLVKRFHENLPPDLKPSTGVSNADELIFDKIDSGYLVAIATHEGAGRSATAQLLHCSEVAFWPDLPIQMAALMQTVPDLPGTEVILETTAYGFNDFRKLWRKSEAGENEFQTIFLPWSVDPNYRANVPPDIKFDPEEIRLMEMHGLDAEQIFWRRNKISQLTNPETFPQEYPLIAAEAFIASSFDSFISADIVIRARKEKDRAARKANCGRRSCQHWTGQNINRVPPRPLHHQGREQARFGHDGNDRLDQSDHPRAEACPDQSRCRRSRCWYLRSSDRARPRPVSNQRGELWRQAGRTSAYR